MITIICTVLAALQLASLTQASSGIQITAASDHVFSATASPVWHNETLSLYFCDTLDQEYTIVRFDYETKEVFGASVPDVPIATFIFPIAGAENEFIISSKRQVKHIHWDGRSPNATVLGTVFEVETDPSYSGNILHFAKIDPEDRLYFGTARTAFCIPNLTTPLGSFYVYTKERGVQVIATGFEAAGGFGWNLEKNLYFGGDDCANDVLQFSYTDDGTYYDEKTLIHIPPPADFPESVFNSLTSDSDGNIWVNRYNGTSIYHVDTATGTIINQVEMPTTVMTGLTFGGPNLDILFVTTDTKSPDAIRGGVVYEKLTPDYAGKLFQVTGLGTTGQASGRFYL